MFSFGAGELCLKAVRRSNQNGFDIVVLVWVGCFQYWQWSSELSQTVKPKIFNLSSKTLSRYQTNILLLFFCAAQNLHPHLTAIILNLNLKYKFTRADCDLLSLSKTKKQTKKIFFKNNLLFPQLEI